MREEKNNKNNTIFINDDQKESYYVIGDVVVFVGFLCNKNYFTVATFIIIENLLDLNGNINF